MRLVHRGQAPYALEVLGKLPPGLQLTADGWLRGTPTAKETYEFTVRLGGQAGGKAGDQTGGQQQRYRVVVAAAPGPAKAVPTTLPASAAASKVDTKPAEPRSWQLTADDLKALTAKPQGGGNPTEAKGETKGEAKFEDEDDSGTAATADPPAPEVPTADQKKELLDPLVGLEFPTEALLRHALRASVCRYYEAHVKAIIDLVELGADARCPEPRAEQAATPLGTGQALPRVVHRAATQRALAALEQARKDEEARAKAKAQGVATPAPVAQAKAGTPPKRTKAVSTTRADADPGGELTLAQFHTQLMTPQWEDQIVAKAVKPHALTDLKPLLLQAKTECGCNLSLPTDEAYGLLAYWHAQPDPLQIDFSLFTRIGFLGAVLQEDGSVGTSYASLNSRGLGFVRTAQKHATRVDLVIHGRDWAFLRAQDTADKRQTYIKGAVSRALALADTTLDDGQRRLHRLLVPPWRESDHAFDGITLFFEQGQAQDAENFRLFLHDFVPALLDAMRARKRPLRLNVVVPDHLIGDTGTYSIDWLWQAWTGTEKGLSDAQKEARRAAAYADKSARVEHRTEITMQYLVLLSEPTSSMKKALRARLDASKTVTGDMRVRLLQNMVPVLLHQQSGKVGSMPAKSHDQFEDDLAYMRWNYGGFALWPLAAQNLGTGLEVQEAVRRAYSESASLGDSVCSVVCPVRVGLRLALQVLLLIGFVSIGLYIWNCEVRQLGKPYLLSLWAGGLLTASVALLLLGCDPDMQRWRKPEVLVAILLAPLFIWGLWRTLKSKETRP